MSDQRQQHKQQKVCILAETDEFIPMLKRYANLVEVIFGDLTTFQSVERGDSCVEGFSCEARKLISMATKGYILCILLLQLRQFTLGEVNIFCEFTTMYGDLQAKRATIHHSEMPLEILTNSTETPSPPATMTPEIQVLDMDMTQKKPWVAKLKIWHPKLKAPLSNVHKNIKLC